MKKAPLVIIFVNYNGYHDTVACVKSIKLHDDKNSFVIIVDNASTENEDLEALKEIHYNTHLIYNTDNIGFGRANNIGIQWAQQNLNFEHLLLLNNDTLIAKGALTSLTEPFKINKEIGVTTAKIFYESNRDLIWYGGADINYKRGWPKIVDFNKKPSLEGADKARFVSFISGCCMMFSKESINKLKGFDDDFFMYCEDLELSMRANKLGYKLYYHPKSVIYHKVQGSFKNKVEKGMKAGNPNLLFLFTNMKTNQFKAMKKHLNTLNFIVFNFFYWNEFIMTTLKLFLKGRTDMFKISLKTINKIISN